RRPCCWPWHAACAATTPRWPCWCGRCCWRRPPWPSPWCWRAVPGTCARWCPGCTARSPPADGAPPTLSPMHLVQLFLPLYDAGGRRFPRALFDAVRAELTEHFGGVTAFSRAPATGLWEDD